MSEQVHAEISTSAVEVPDCPSCGCSEASSLYVDIHDGLLALDGTFGVVECARCGLVRTSPRPTPEAITRYYPDDYVAYAATSAQQTSWLYRAARSVARLPYRLTHGPELATPAPPYPGAAALDIGCGAGEMLRRLQARGWDVYGVEPSVSTAERVRDELGLGGDRIVTAAAEDALFPEASFELVRMSHVLEHLYQPVEVLRSVHGWLVPDGELWISVPNFAGCERRIFGRHWFGLDVPRHLFHFTPITLHAVLHATGFELKSTRADLFAVSLAGSVQRLLTARKGTHARPSQSRRLYVAAIPTAALLSVMGWASTMTVIATRR